MISVIVPAYNSERNISEAISSILKQTYQDFEIIIIDDGSTDNTKPKVFDYIDKNPGKIRYFYQQNKGPGYARNRGIEEARGEYIAFLDADDTLIEESLSERADFLDENPNVSAVFADYYLRISDKDHKLQLAQTQFLDFFKDTIKYRSGKRIIFGERFYFKYLEFSPLPVWTGTVMMRKEIIKEIGHFKTDISVGEDTEYWLRIIKRYNIGYISEPLAYYNHHKSRLTKQAEKTGLDCINLYQELYRNSLDARIRKILKKRLAESYYSLGYYYRNNALLKKARKYLAKSIINNPGCLKSYKNLLLTFIPQAIKNEYP